jgi:hypothetical protein
VDIFILGSFDPHNNNFINLMRNRSDQFIAGAAEFVTAMVKNWYEAANQYDNNRKQSAVVQLRNAGASATDIDSVLNDPMLLRQFISEQRRDLMDKLSKIVNKMSYRDPMDLPTQKDLELFAKHESWFMNGAVDDNEYYPNDGAVSYTYLIVELVNLIKNAGVTGVMPVWNTFHYILKIMNANLTNQSSRKGWTLLAQFPDHTYNGFNVSTLIRSYVTDQTRNISPQDKQSSPFGRSPLRIMRIAQCLCDCNGPFSLMNAPVERALPTIMNVYSIEQEIKDLTANASFISEGAEGLFIAFTVTWLLALDRQTIMADVTGRNDLSVPKLLESITNLSMPGHLDLRARKWALDHDITGADDERDPIIIDYFGGGFDAPDHPFQSDQGSDSPPDDNDPDVAEEPQPSSPGPRNQPTGGAPKRTVTLIENKVAVPSTGLSPPSAHLFNPASAVRTPPKQTSIKPGSTPVPSVVQPEVVTLGDFEAHLKAMDTEPASLGTVPVSKASSPSRSRRAVPPKQTTFQLKPKPVKDRTVLGGPMNFFNQQQQKPGNM